jgi:hypothetical protein
VSVPGQPVRHLRTIFALRPRPQSVPTAGNMLVTITCQATEEAYGGVKGLFDEVVESYTVK